jgi:hypothetical protein
MFAGRLDRKAFAVDFGNRMVQWHDWDSEFGIMYYDSPKK